MRVFTPRAMLWLAVGLAFVMALIIRCAAHDLGTGLLVSVSVAAMVVLGFWDRAVIPTTCLVVSLAFCLELVIHEGLFVLELLVLMFGGFLMAFIGRQIRRAQEQQTAAREGRAGQPF